MAAIHLLKVLVTRMVKALPRWKRDKRNDDAGDSDKQHASSREASTVGDSIRHSLTIADSPSPSQPSSS